MGVRGEVFSITVALANRTYFFNVKENRLGDLYLNIVESKNRESGGFERQSVILFAEDLPEFLKGFEESLRVMDKASREKRRKNNDPGLYRDGKDREENPAGAPGKGKRVILKSGRTRTKAREEKDGGTKAQSRKPRQVRAVRREK
ncbi:MAG: PUR family DNA/RNA-binding protein [Treponema sp.]|jgi:hypothetical protein|nr:PUR family DNA/RNA-binding protein [Treponema sp.]